MAESLGVAASVIQRDPGEEDRFAHACSNVKRYARKPGEDHVASLPRDTSPARAQAKPLSMVRPAIGGGMRLSGSRGSFAVDGSARLQLLCDFLG